DRLARALDASGVRLAAAIVQPLAARLRGRRLLVVPDRSLHYVPFAALPDPASGEPLLERYEITYLPSASVLATLRGTSDAGRRNPAVAVFADPVFSSDDPRLTGRAQIAARNEPVTRDEQRRLPNGFLPRLRFSRKEAEAIAAAAKAATFEALDFDASKETLAATPLRDYPIIHFATHGALDTEHPELSGLVLSLFDAKGRKRDGFLRLHEIYNLDLDAELVVLSACETALGKEVHGEGLIGITRGFMYAGAERVVSSIWKVDDRASARMMTRFYERVLESGASPSAALRDAQLAMWRDARWRDPHYWAAFGLYGEWK
ncbi:MAG TPA: CHAT domain-containing protein, partial [Thermoanaerobaculia bacterium]